MPVAAEAVGQVTEYIRDGRTGMLCASGDVAGLVNGAVNLFGTDMEKREQLTAAAQADMREIGSDGRSWLGF